MKWLICKFVYSTQNPYKVDTYSGTEEEALEYTRLLAKEHADRIQVVTWDYDNETCFMTNNGTPVSYRAIRMED